MAKAFGNFGEKSNLEAPSSMRTEKENKSGLNEKDICKPNLVLISRTV
jgi:hypothetical protein